MQIPSRILVALVLLGALLAMLVPLQARVASKATAHGCCAQMEQKSEAMPDCPRHEHSPQKPQQRDASCCQLCAAGMALLYSSPAPFVNAATGEEALVSQNDRSDALPHRPPVPPPRGALA